MAGAGWRKEKAAETDGTVFKNVFIANRRFLYKGDYTAPPEENDYLGAKNYLTEDGLAGFSVTGSGWLVSLYSNYGKSGFARAVREYVVPDAYKLVCIATDTDRDNRLIRLYESVYGFRIYARTINDTEVMEEHYGRDFIANFISANGTPFHVFMIGAQAAGNGHEIKEFKDYFEAEAYVDKTVKRFRF